METHQLKYVQELDIPRRDYVLTTKIFWGGPTPNAKGLNRKHIVEGTKVGLIFTVKLFWGWEFCAESILRHMIESLKGELLLLSQASLKRLQVDYVDGEIFILACNTPVSLE